MNFFYLLHPFHGISSVILQVINTFWLKTKRGEKGIHEGRSNSMSPIWTSEPHWDVTFFKQGVEFHEGKRPERTGEKILQSQMKFSLHGQRQPKNRKLWLTVWTKKTSKFLASGLRSLVLNQTKEDMITKGGLRVCLNKVLWNGLNCTSVCRARQWKYPLCGDSSFFEGLDGGAGISTIG